MISLFSKNKVLLGIILTAIIGGLTAIQTQDGYAWAGTAVAILTLIGHSTNLVKGVK